jgi:uncharacterized membrane protein YjfL (UPF0719 family)
MNALRLVVLTLMFTGPSLMAADAESSTTASWHAQTLGQALLYTFIFAASGIIIAIAGYKLFDFFTPGDLHKEIVEKQNVAAAIVAGAVVLGICLIIAAAMIS